LSIRFGSSVVFAGIALLGCGLRFAAALLRRIVVFGWNGRSVSESVGGLSMDTELQKHYAFLLGIGSSWAVKAVELKLHEKKVEIELGWQGSRPSAWNADGSVRSTTARRSGRGGIRTRCSLPP
jgi:hypothetical protein